MKKKVAMNFAVCLVSASSREEEFKTKNKMKNKQTALKALLVAGIVGSMMDISVANAVSKGLPKLPPVATIAVASLTAAQIAALSSADGGALSTAAAAILAGVPIAQRAELAKSISAYVAQNKTAAAAVQVVTLLVAQVPAAASQIIQVALVVAPALQTAMTIAMPAQAATIVVAAAAAAESAIATTPAAAAPSNPLDSSAS